MTTHDEIGLLIPWYANLTVPDADRRRVEEHLPNCERCRDLLERASSFHEAGGACDDQILLGHVQASLLSEFVRRSDRIDPETVAWIESHLNSCDPCSEAAAIVDRMHGRASGTLSGGGIWSFLAGGLLQPVPALAYLLVAVAALSVLAVQRPWSPSNQTRPGEAPGTGVMVLSAPIKLPGEITFRGREVEGDDAHPPLDVPMPAAGLPLHLELLTDLDPLDLAVEGLSVSLALSDGDRRVWSAMLDPGDVSNTGAVDLLVPRGLLQPGAVLELTLRYEQPGAELDGHLAYRQRFRVR